MPNKGCFVERAFQLKKGRGPIKASALDPLVIFPGSALDLVRLLIPAVF